MTDDTDRARLRIAQDLTAITTMYAHLWDEAAHKYADRLFPGGDALNLLGPAANLEAWDWIYELAEWRERFASDDPDADVDVHKWANDYASDQIDAEHHPLMILTDWEEKIRLERGQPTELRATVKRAADYIRSSLDWLLGHNERGEPNFIPIDALITDLRRVRGRLETVLRDGDRDDHINARCKSETCERRPRLAIRRGEGVNGTDFWQCPSCRQVYDEAGVGACWHKMIAERGDAPEWLTISQAALAIGRSPKTIRRWINDRDGRGNKIKPKVESRYRDDNDRVTEVRWADVRAADDTAQRRGRYRRIAPLSFTVRAS